MEFKSIKLDGRDKREFRDSILEEVCDLTKNKCHISEVYTSDNVVEFKPCKINFNEDMLNTLNKITRFYNSLDNIRLNYLKNAKIEKELEYIDNQGIHCVFISILTKLFFKRRYDLNLNLVQGYYKFENNMFASMVFGKYSLGFHAWCELDGAVIDLTFNTQQSSSYNGFLEGDNVIGIYNDDIELVGYVENDTVVNKYLDDFLKINSLSLNEWLDMYSQYLDLR